MAGGRGLRHRHAHRQQRGRDVHHATLLATPALKKQKIDHFDSWAATFGEPVTAMELAPDGAGYRLHTRFARFINVPELMQQFRQVRRRADRSDAETCRIPESSKPAKSHPSAMRRVPRN
jgi:N12 class adenine-specific DNA methylase